MPRDSLAIGKIRAGAPPLAQFRSRLTLALTLSLLLHAFILSLRFGAPGLGLPGLDLPWNERRAHAPELQLRLNNVNRAPLPPAPLSVPPSPPPDKPAAEARYAPPTVRETSPPVSRLQLLSQSEAQPAPPPRQTQESSVASAHPERGHAPIPHRRRHRRRPSAVKSKPPVIAKSTPRPDAFAVPPPGPEARDQQAFAAPPEPGDDALARRQAEEMQEALRQAEEHAAQLAAQQIEQEKMARQAQQLEEKRQEEETARQLALENEARRQADEQMRRLAAQQAEQEEKIRQVQQLEEKRREEETARQLALENEARRQTDEQMRRQAAQQAEQEEKIRQAQQLEEKRREEETTRRLALENEARRQAAQRLAEEESARRLDDQRQQEAQAARQAAEAARQTGQLAAAGDIAGSAAGQNAEAGASQRREPAAATANRAQPAPASGDSGAPAESDNEPILLSDSDMAAMQVRQVRKVDLTRLDAPAARELAAVSQQARRRSVFGSADDDIVLKMYIDSWRQAVERNGNLQYQSAPAERPRGDALVTIAVRSDGQIDSIVLTRSSGVPELDATVRQILQSSERHDAFPPDLKRRYDVIEIRRVWRFDDRLRIVEEGR